MWAYRKSRGKSIESSPYSSSCSPFQLRPEASDTSFAPLGGKNINPDHVEPLRGTISIHYTIPAQLRRKQSYITSSFQELGTRVDVRCIEISCNIMPFIGEGRPWDCRIWSTAYMEENLIDQIRSMPPSPNASRKQRQTHLQHLYGVIHFQLWIHISRLSCDGIS